MREAHLEHLVCPACRGALTLTQASERKGDRIVTGTLACPRCHVTHPVVRQVPRFVAMDNYAAGFGLQWNRHARTQYDSHTGVPLSERRFFEASRWPRHLEGERVLEVGCGAGRFTEQAAGTGALVTSLDYSQAVDANQAGNGHRENVLIVQADLYQMPFRTDYFDRVFCFGVLQHTPDVHRSFLELPRYLKPGGALAVDVYRRAPWWVHATITKYWVRPLTRRMNPSTLYRLVGAWVKTLWPLTHRFSRHPVGRKIAWRLLVADYQGVFPLPEPLLKEWAVLDTFDMLSPAFDQPQTQETMRRWFAEAGLDEIEVHPGHNGLEGRGRKPAGIAEHVAIPPTVAGSSQEVRMQP